MVFIEYCGSENSIYWFVWKWMVFTGFCGSKCLLPSVKKCEWCLQGSVKMNGVSCCCFACVCVCVCVCVSDTVWLVSTGGLWRCDWCLRGLVEVWRCLLGSVEVWLVVTGFCGNVTGGYWVLWKCDWCLLGSVEMEWCLLGSVAVSYTHLRAHETG